MTLVARLADVCDGESDAVTDTESGYTGWCESDYAAWDECDYPTWDVVTDDGLVSAGFHQEQVDVRFDAGPQEEFKGS